VFCLFRVVDVVGTIGAMLLHLPIGLFLFDGTSRYGLVRYLPLGAWTGTWTWIGVLVSIDSHSIGGVLVMVS